MPKDLNSSKVTYPALYILLFLLCLSGIATAQENSAAQPLLTDFQDGRLIFSDQSSLPFVHWQDTAYTVFVFVRHAEKILDGSKDPDLTPEGHARAARLGEILDGFLLDSVFSTNYKRTLQTADAVQQKGALPAVQLYTPGAQADLLSRLCSTAKNKRVLIVGHQNTVPLGLNHLKTGANYQTLGDTEYHRFFLVSTNGYADQTEILELFF